MKRSDYLTSPKEDFWMSLVKVTGKEIKDVTGYITTEYGEPSFAAHSIVFTDGTEAWLQGEHDMVNVYEGYHNGKAYKIFDEKIMDFLIKSDPDYDENEE